MARAEEQRQREGFFPAETNVRLSADPQLSAATSSWKSGAPCPGKIHHHWQSSDPSILPTQVLCHNPSKAANFKKSHIPFSLHTVPGSRNLLYQTSFFIPLRRNRSLRGGSGEAEARTPASVFQKPSLQQRTTLAAAAAAAAAESLCPTQARQVNMGQLAYFLL